MIKAPLLTTLLFICSLVFGQNQRVLDSLENELKSTADDITKVDIYNQIAMEYSGVDSIGSQTNVEKAYSLADKIDYKNGKADVLFILSRNYMLTGRYTNAEKHLEALLSMADRIDYPKAKANGFFALGWLNYYRGDYEESIKFHKQALTIRESLKDSLDISTSLRGIGITHKLLGDFDSALKFLKQSLNIEQQQNNSKGVAECLNHIGVISSLRGDLPSALDAYYKALEIQKKIDDKKGLALTYQNIGFVHNAQKDFNKTLEYYQKSLAHRQEINETRGVAQITYNMGLVYHEIGAYDQALESYNRALEMETALGNRKGMADNYLNIGRLYADQKMFEEAVENQEVALSIAKEIQSDWGKVDALLGLGTSYNAKGEFLKAKQVLIEANTIANEARLLESLKEGARLLAQVENSLGHYQDAYEAQILYQQISDSLSSEEMTRRITLLEAEYRFAQEKDSIQYQNDKDKLLLDQKLNSQQNVIIIFIITLVVGLIILAILYRYYRLKNYANKRLSLLNNEKNNLIKIVAHDLKNPLAGISAACDLLEDNELNEDQKKLKNVIAVSSARMSKMVSEILNVEEIEKSAEEIRVKPHNLSETVREVCDRLCKQAAAKEIDIQTFVKDDLVGLVDERYVEQIVENLVSNAVKFSPPNKRVEVSLSQHSDKLTLQVKDEGPGLSTEDMDKLFQRFQRLSARPTGEESSTGLGLSIVKDFVSKMQGRVWAESIQGKGASFFVEFKAGTGA